MMEPKEDTSPMMTPVKADDDDGIAMLTSSGGCGGAGEESPPRLPDEKMAWIESKWYRQL